MAGQAGALPACAGRSGRPAEDRLRHRDRRFAARAAEIVGRRSAVAGETRSPEPVQYRSRDDPPGRTYERPAQSRPLALERADGTSLARRMVSRVVSRIWSTRLAMAAVSPCDLQSVR